MAKVSQTPNTTVTMVNGSSSTEVVVSAATSVPDDVRESWNREGKCVGCGVQVFRLKKHGWRKNKVSMVPLSIDGKVSRGQCVSCSSKLQQLLLRESPLQQQSGEEPTEVSLIDDDRMYDDEEDDEKEDVGNRQSAFQLQLKKQVKVAAPDVDDEDDGHPYFDSKAGEPTLKGSSSDADAAGKRELVFYDGSFNSSGQPHGNGEIVFANGDRYHGQIFNGKLHGQGTMLFANGSDYVGGWECGYMHGSGTFRFANGDTYNGEFKSNKRCGQGMMYFSNGDLYTGPWQDGQMQGLGRYHYQNGHKFEGIFVSGKRHGKGKYQYPDGTLMIHKYVHDQRVGEGVKLSPDRKQAWRSIGGKAKGRITRRKAELIMLRCDEE